MSSRRTKITENYEISTKWALRRCIGAQKSTELLEVLGEDTLPWGHWDSVQTGARRELFEFCNLKNNPLRDLHKVVEYPERLIKRLLEWRIARRESKFSIWGRKEKRRVSLEVEAIGKLRRDSTYMCMKTLQRHRSPRILQGFKRRKYQEEQRHRERRRGLNLRSSQKQRKGWVLWDTWNHSKSEKESAKGQEEKHRPLDQLIDFGPSDFPRSGESRRSAEKRRSWAIGSHLVTCQSLDQLKTCEV